MSITCPWILSALRVYHHQYQHHHHTHPKNPFLENTSPKNVEVHCVCGDTQNGNTPPWEIILSVLILLPPNWNTLPQEMVFSVLNLLPPNWNTLPQEMVLSVLILLPPNWNTPPQEMVLSVLILLPPNRNTPPQEMVLSVLILLPPNWNTPPQEMVLSVLILLPPFTLILPQWLTGCKTPSYVLFFLQTTGVSDRVHIKTNAHSKQKRPFSVCTAGWRSETWSIIACGIKAMSTSWSIIPGGVMSDVHSFCISAEGCSRDHCSLWCQPFVTISSIQNFNIRTMKFRISGTKKECSLTNIVMIILY